MLVPATLTTKLSTSLYVGIGATFLAGASNIGSLSAKISVCETS